MLRVHGMRQSDLLAKLMYGISEGLVVCREDILEAVERFKKEFGGR